MELDTFHYCVRPCEFCHDSTRYNLLRAMLMFEDSTETAKRAALQARLDARCCPVGTAIRLDL